MITNMKGLTKRILLLGVLLLPGVLMAAPAADEQRLPDPAFESQVAEIQARIRALPAGPVRVALERRLAGTLHITAYDPPGLASYAMSGALGAGAGAAVGGLAGGIVYALNGSRNKAFWRTPMLAMAGVGLAAGVIIHNMNKRSERHDKSTDLDSKLADWRRILTAAEANPLANLTGEQANAISNPGESRHEGRRSGSWFGQLIGHDDESIIPELIGGVAGHIAGDQVASSADAARTRAAIEAIQAARPTDGATARARGEALRTRLDEVGEPPNLISRLTLGGFLGMTGAGITSGLIQMFKPGVASRGQAFMMGLGKLPKWGGIVGGALGAGLLYLTYQHSMNKRDRALDVSHVTASDAPAAPATAPTAPAAGTPAAPAAPAPAASAPTANEPAPADAPGSDLDEDLRRTE